MKKNANLSDYFSWLANEVSENCTGATPTIIYCQTIKQCALVYTTIKILLGEKIYEDLCCAVRAVSSDQTSMLGCELNTFHKSLLIDLWKRDSS